MAVAAILTTAAIEQPSPKVTLPAQIARTPFTALRPPIGDPRQTVLESAYTATVTEIQQIEHRLTLSPSIDSAAALIERRERLNQYRTELTDRLAPAPSGTDSTPTTP